MHKGLQPVRVRIFASGTKQKAERKNCGRLSFWNWIKFGFKLWQNDFGNNCQFCWTFGDGQRPFSKQIYYKKIARKIRPKNFGTFGKVVEGVSWVK